MEEKQIEPGRVYRITGEFPQLQVAGVDESSSAATRASSRPRTLTGKGSLYMMQREVEEEIRLYNKWTKLVAGLKNLKITGEEGGVESDPQLLPNVRALYANATEVANQYEVNTRKIRQSQAESGEVKSQLEHNKARSLILEKEMKDVHDWLLKLELDSRSKLPLTKGKPEGMLAATGALSSKDSSKASSKASSRASSKSGSGSRLKIEAQFKIRELEEKKKLQKRFASQIEQEAAAQCAAKVRMEQAVTQAKVRME